MSQNFSLTQYIYTVVDNWNCPTYTLDCINSLPTQESISLEVINVDSESTYDSVFIIRGKFPQVGLLANHTSLTFGRGHNPGMRHALAMDIERFAHLICDLLQFNLGLCKCIEKSGYHITCNKFNANHVGHIFASRLGELLSQ